MSWSNYLFSFEGRIGRMSYWLYTVLIMVVALVAGVVEVLLDIPFVGIVVQLLMIWPCWAIAAKRWHDRNKSGWWILIALIPVVGLLWTLVECGFLPGTNGPNRFGNPPGVPQPA